MKKKFLLLLLAVASIVGMQADNYYYSHTARYKALGENLVVNGNFADGFTGWTNEEGGSASAEVWSAEPGAAPDGSNAIMSLDGSEGTGNALVQKWQLDAGTYIISYYIKAEGAQTTSITAGSANYVDVFTNTDGSLVKGSDAVQVAARESFNDDWTQVVSMTTVESNGFLVFVAQRLATGTQIANVEVRPAKEVYDIRIMERMIAYAEQLLADENLTEGRDDVEGALEGMIKPLLADETATEDKSEMESLMETFQNEVLGGFLEANGTNLVGGKLTDWSTWSAVNYSKMGTRGTWAFEGGRWGFTGATDYLEFNAADGYIASAGIQTSMQLNASMRTAAGALSDLPAGKYFFSIEAQAVAASNRANPYGADHNIAIVGPKIFVGNDTTVLDNDTLSGYYWKTYYKIAEVKEGEEVKMGFIFPVTEGKKGGRYSLRNPQVRQLGVNAEEAAFVQQKNAFIVQQYNLGLRLTNYPVELKDYKWGLDSLDRAIVEAQPVYDASLLIIDAEGNVLQRDLVDENHTQLMLDHVNALGRARNYIITLNAPIDELKAAVEAANASLNDAANAGAQASLRTALQAAVANGQQLLDNISATQQVDEFNAAIKAIKEAKEQFEATTANRANPTEILIKNADFTDFAANNNITTFDAPVKDWNWSVAASANRWEIRDNETLSQGHGASIWRGTTVQLDGKAMQSVELTYEGLYEYRAEAYISEERVNELVAASTIIYDAIDVAVDTLFTPNIRLFFGEWGAPDSITVSKWYNGVKNDGSYFTREISGTKYPGMVYATYSVFFKKTGTAPVTVEFGLEAADNYSNAGANGFGFGNNRIFYVGDEAQYLADTKKEVAAAVANAKLVADTDDNYWTVKLNRYIKDAEEATTAKQMQNALHGINEVSSRIGGISSGMEGVKTYVPTETQVRGAYSLTGIKMATDANRLKPGFYIVNGKKYIVK